MLYNTVSYRPTQRGSGQRINQASSFEHTNEILRKERFIKLFSQSEQKIPIYLCTKFTVILTYVAVVCQSGHYGGLLAFFDVCKLDLLLSLKSS